MSTPYVSLHPWDQQPGEPDHYYTVFRCFLEIGPQRSYRAAREAALAANQNAPCISRCNGAGSTWHWQERAAAWDAAHPGLATPAAVHPWDQQLGEPDHYYAVFQRYLALGPQRSYVAAAADVRAANPHTPCDGCIRQAGATWHWRDRAAAWDDAHPDLAAPPPTIQPWDQQPGEPDLLYAVFLAYLDLRPRRTYHAAHTAFLAVHPTARLPHDHQHTATRWNWRARAQSWDAAHPEQLQPLPTVDPWDQQPGETDRWYALFRRYLGLGLTRSIHQLVMQCETEGPGAPSATACYSESRRRRWEERAEAWDLSDEACIDLVAAPPTAYTPTADLEPWDQQPGEPLRLYSYFCHYLELGPTRSIARTFQDLGQGQGSNPVSTAAYARVRRWHWEERAAAWDARQRDLFTARVMDRRVALAEHRLDVAEVAFDEAVAALEIANLGGVSEDQARRMLGAINRLLVLTAKMQRDEFDYLDKLQAAQSKPFIVTANVLAAASEQLDRFRAEQAARRSSLPALPLLNPPHPDNPEKS